MASEARGLKYQGSWLVELGAYPSPERSDRGLDNGGSGGRSPPDRVAARFCNFSVVRFSLLKG